MMRLFSVAGVCMLLAILFTASASATPQSTLSDAWARYSRDAAQQSPAYRFPYQHCFDEAAQRHEMPVTLLLAVARGESDFNVTARSKADAHGLMQILWPGTAQDLGFSRVSELYEPCRNVDAGARYLKQMLKRYDGDLHLALAAYNYGPRRIPVGAERIPQGAEWYSGYIFRHLGYVLGDGRRAVPSGTAYDAERKILLVEFAAPYRAQAFVDTMEAASPQLRLDWFRVEAGRFRVVMSYSSDSELANARAGLAGAGFELDWRD